MFITTVLRTVSDQTKKYKTINMRNIPLYSMNDKSIEGSSFLFSLIKKPLLIKKK
jgi:hypothetical protein